MREHQVARASIEYLGIGEKFADHVVRKMAGAAHHALFDVPWVRTHFEHLEIMIRFENQEIGLAEMLFDEFGQIAEVGSDGDFRAIGAKGIADRVGGIVWNPEGINPEIADFEFVARMNVFDPLHFLEWAIRKHSENFAMRWLGEVGRAFPFASHLREARAMVGMLVGD